MRGVLHAYGTHRAPDGRARAEFQIRTSNSHGSYVIRATPSTSEEQIYTVVTRVGRGLYNRIYLDASMCEMRSRHLDE